MTKTPPPTLREPALPRFGRRQLLQMAGLTSGSLF